ncbi:MAG TPA: histidine kinase dimerization/phosphoacceptor domain -containing protein [Flavobacterium sp.]|uniref:histidine kinase dimerization/phosphoacceptor domain -containing protein n=1 Tax=Flavobacterium sp. TaxID=239 RepID=UPI002DBAC3BC|nr:histidine kinase dimerization/phosphoacceptor domain -containing protein [Flavobacterium sp.]HEU4789793.1 histidine kinase dimerization/phosphoacceptor domain -containing protein [Flavobacterium sp.]
MKQLYCFYLLLFVTFSSFAQIPSSTANYDLKKKRLLIQFCSMFLYGKNQGKIDEDSSAVLAAKAYNLPVSLSYDEGYNDGNPLIGSELIEKGNINAVKRLLARAKGIDRVKLLLQLGSFYLFKPGTKPDDLQNAFTNIQEAVQISNQLKIQKWQHQSLMLLGKFYAQTNNIAESKNCFTKVVKECQKQNDQKALADALANQAEFLPNSDPQKEALLNEVIKRYTTLGLEEKKIELHMRLITVHYWTGNTKLALKEFYQSLYYQRKAGFKHTHFTEATISYIELLSYNTKSALYYALKSIKTMESINDYNFADIFYLRFGNVYLALGHYKEALDLYKKSIEAGHQNINSGGSYRSFVSLVAALSSVGKTREALDYINSMTANYPPTNPFDKMIISNTKANCYDILNNYPLADKHYKEMDRYAQQLTGPATLFDVLNAYSAMTAFYARRHQAKEAKFYADKILALSKVNNRHYTSENLEISQSITDSLSGNYLSAFKHYQNFKKIRDSIVDFTKNKQIEELKIQYETLNKEQKIKLLNDQSKLQKSELQKSKLLNTLSIWSVALLLIVIGLLYNRYRLKQQNNIKLEFKEKEINQKNNNLRHLLDEKEWLMKEIHHRVKNNLQTVISLLNSQSAYLDNDMALSAIKNSQHRIHSMSLIHQKLYNSENISTINMPNYIKELVEYLKESFNLGQRIRFEIKVAPLELDVAHAVPLGLILNEAITNSIKYAFPDDRNGIISVSLEITAEKHYRISISDNGIGIDPNFGSKKVNSFGMSLIKGLSDDLEGKFTMESHNGTTLKIDFLSDFPTDKKNRNDPE